MRIGYLFGQVVVLAVQVFSGLILLIAAGQFLSVAWAAHAEGNSPVVFAIVGIGTAALASVFAVPRLFRQVLSFGAYGPRRLLSIGLFLAALLWMSVPVLALMESDWWGSVPQNQKDLLRYGAAALVVAYAFAFMYPGAAFAPYRITAEDLARDVLPRRRWLILLVPVSLAYGERWTLWRRAMQLPALILVLAGIFGAFLAPGEWLSNPQVLLAADRWWMSVGLGAAILAMASYLGLKTRSPSRALKTERQRLSAVLVILTVILVFATPPALKSGLPALAHYALISDEAEARVQVAGLGVGERRLCAYVLQVVWPDRPDLPAPVCDQTQEFWSGAKVGDTLVLRGHASALGLHFTTVEAGAAP